MQDVWVILKKATLFRLPQSELSIVECDDYGKDICYDVNGCSAH